jgi:hypothetical protein
MSKPSMITACLSLLLGGVALAGHPAAPSPSASPPATPLPPIGPTTPDRDPAALAALRAEGPAALTRLLASYDAAPPGAARDALAATVDAVAGQRYATVSRLYWYTDLAAARAAAHASGRPILALRLLGRLDQDRSCANSRFFRTMLYSDTATSRLLRERFVLYWSSERPVPQVTIDFGDGRKLERTTTGNSAHFVLDADGHVLDVLPGLYAPAAFRHELAGSLALAQRVRGLAAAARAQAIASYHYDLVAAAAQFRQTLPGLPYMPGERRLLTQRDVSAALAEAQRATMSKAYVEVPDLRFFASEAAPGEAGAQQAYWASAGQALYHLGDLTPMPAAAQRPWGARPPAAAATPAPHVLDATSRQLVLAVHALPAGTPSITEAAPEAFLARLEQHVDADSALDQLELRPQISRFLVDHHGEIELDALDAWIYATVFHTPPDDAWLGLLPRTDYTGLPGDGVVLP